MFGCDCSNSDRAEMLSLAALCTSINEALLNFLEGVGDDSSLAERVREAIKLFRTNPFARGRPTYAQLVVFRREIKYYETPHGDLLFLINPRMPERRKKGVAKRIIKFFEGLHGECSWHYEMNTHFGPPKEVVEMLTA